MRTKLLGAMVASLALVTPSLAQTNGTNAMKTGALPSTLTRDDVRMVAPALDEYTQGTLLDNLWRRPDLTPRDRSIVTLSALIARNQTVGMSYYVNLALDSGVKPGEISEVITHLAFYTGWGNAMSAVAVVKNIFAQRGSGPISSPQLRLSFSRWIRRPRRSGRRVSGNRSVRWLQVSSVHHRHPVP